MLVDPTGEALAFLSRQWEERGGGAGSGLARASFVSGTFLKSVESALRFGVALLVTDAERADPSLNAVLDRETRRAGGRVLVQLADAEVDISPAFTLYLATREPAHAFPPAFSSRVSVVTFATTRTGLEAACLDRLLRCTRPALQARKAEVQALQGEYRARLLSLERRLLSELSSLEGDILDSTSLMGALESLKREAAETELKAAHADETMDELAAAAAAFQPLAELAAATHFAMQALSSVRPLYQHSLAFFVDIFDRALERHAAETAALSSTLSADEEQEQLRKLERTFFDGVLRRVLPGLLKARHV